MKKIFLSIFLFILAHFRSIETIEPVKVVAFDCHGVLFEKKPWNVHNEIISFIWNHYEVIPKSCIILPKLLYHWFHGTELTVTNIINNIPELQPYKDVLYEFVKLKKPILKTIEILKKLKQNNIIIVLASNIHEDAFAYNKEIMPEIFELFDVCYTRLESNNISKENAHYFLNMYNFICTAIGHTNVHVLFIDDDYNNVVIAQNVHEALSAVHFVSAEKLEADLVKKNYFSQ